MKVHNRQPRLLVACGIRFLPNAYTVVPPEREAAVEANEQFQVWRDLKWVHVVGESSASAEPSTPSEEQELSPDWPETLEGMTIAEALPLVVHCEDAERLLAWYSAEERSTLQARIEARIQQLEPPAEPESPAEPVLED